MKPAAMIQPLDLHWSEFKPGLTVIEASAGTGKTYSISHLVPRLLIEGTLPDLSQLLLVTFTKDAARELADRVRKVLTVLSDQTTVGTAAETEDIQALRGRLHADPAAQQRLQQAMVNLDQLAVSTIHAFCQRTLQQEGALCGLPVLPELVTDDAEYLGQALRQAWINGLKDDRLLAAMATGMEWSLDDAANVARHHRAAPSPQPVPAPRAIGRIRAELMAAIEHLRDEGTWAEIRGKVGAVAKWRKNGPADSNDAVSRLRPLHEASHGSTAFWLSLRGASKVWSEIGGGKSVVDPIKACSWYQTCLDLERLTDELAWSWQHDLAAAVHHGVEEALRRHRLITQDGLIGTLHRALHQGGDQADRLAARLADRYRVALIDESQDTDPRQFEIFGRLFLRPEQPRRLILVGDPKQAIYGFRGADLATYLAARDHAETRYTLNRTFRSPGPLVDAINRLFRGHRPFLNPGMTFQPAESGVKGDRQLVEHGRDQSRLEFWLLPSEGDGSLQKKAERVRGLSAHVATTITHLLMGRAKIRTTQPGGDAVETEVTPADFAILVATHAQADAMAEALQRRGVPVVINSGADVFDTDEARDLLTLLGAILDPRKKARLRAALATRLIGLDARTLGTLNADGAGTAEATAWLDLFTHWQGRWQKAGLATLLAELDRPERAPLKLGLTHRLALVPLTGERRATNYRHLTDLLLLASREEAPRPDELVRWLAQQITQAERRASAEETQLQLSTDRQAVQVLTMHASKGLEYPLVFCPYLAEPLPAARPLEKLPGGEPVAGRKRDRLIQTGLLDKERQDEVKWAAAEAQLEERLRLAYVALTRAKVRVWTASFTPSAKGRSGPRLSPIDWLLENSETKACDEDEVDKANEDRASRHEAALRTLGACPHGEADPTGATPLITFRAPPKPDLGRYQPKADDQATLRGALAQPTVPPAWWVTSFSSLTKEKNAHGDRSRPGDAPEENGPGPAAPGVPAIGFFGAPGSAEVGTVVHDWIERWDFGTIDVPALEEHLRAGPALTRRPQGEKGWATLLEELFRTLREIHLPGAGEVPLEQLCPDPHASEWHFHLPLKDDLKLEAIADCFERHGAEAHQGYAAKLRDLPEKTTRGFLQGFIDRLFRQGEAWGVIDWKTNTLGRSLGDYDEQGMLRCAMDSHYLLQCHLYLVALRRHLRALGLPTANAHEAWLVFVRAIEPGTTRGVLRINPSDVMLDSLDRLFAPAS